KLNSNLEYMNEPSLGQRLKNILVREEKMRSILFEDDTSAKNFINQCVSKRNKLSHPNKNINNGFPDGKYTIVNNKLDFIFAYCLLKYIGLPEDILCKYHGGSPNYFWARRYKIWEKIK
ncbi:MAG: hypothetical protein GYA78_05755, partial [Caldisericales bacterium]|nr:hypothetical protein [Caldisericales bacterium]